MSGWLRGKPGSPDAELGPPAGAVRVRLTDEPWGKWLQVSPAGKVLNPPTAVDRYHSMYDRVIVDRLANYDRAPNKTVLVLHTPRDPYQFFAFEIRAIDTDGQKRWVLCWQGKPAADPDLREEKWGLALPLPDGKQLARYEFRLRPYRDLVTFRNVSLRSGIETDPEVTVRPLPEAGVTARTK